MTMRRTVLWPTQLSVLNQWQLPIHKHTFTSSLWDFPQGAASLRQNDTATRLTSNNTGKTAQASFFFFDTDTPVQRVCTCFKVDKKNRALLTRVCACKNMVGLSPSGMRWETVWTGQLFPVPVAWLQLGSE